MDEKIRTIARLINWASNFLKSKQIPTHRLDSELLLAHLLNLKRIDLYLNPDQILNEEEWYGFKRLTMRRAKREPISYLTGHKEFWSLDFIVTGDVLVPRPETELLVEEALKIFRTNRLSTDCCLILEIGTGSGAVAVSLAKELPGVSVIATDYSFDALRIAKKNAEKCQVIKNVNFLAGDIFGPFKNDRDLSDMVISNPPYIPDHVIQNLPPEVRDFEPVMALDGGKDGLDLYRRIIPQAARYLKKDGYLLLEIGENQEKKVTRMVRETGCFTQCSIIRDLGGNNRVVKTRKSRRSDH